MKHAKKRSVWSLELSLVVAMPFIVIGAIVATILVAADSSFTPEPGVKQDRFAKVTTTAAEPQQ